MYVVESCLIEAQVRYVDADLLNPNEIISSCRQTNNELDYHNQNDIPISGQFNAGLLSSLFQRVVHDFSLVTSVNSYPIAMTSVPQLTAFQKKAVVCQWDQVAVFHQDVALEFV